VTKIAFPREVLPISATLAQCFDTLIGATALAVALPFLGVRPSLALVWVPLLALLLWCLTAAAGLILSCCNLFFRDVKYLVQVLLTFGIFFTPVLYEPQAFGARGATLLMLNPLSPILEGFRLAIVRGHNLLEPISTLSSAGDLVVTWSPFHLVYGAIWAIGALLISSLVFNRLESSFAENI